MMAVNNQLDDESMNRQSLPPTERERSWVPEFRMPEGVFEELLGLVEPHMAPSVPQNTRQRTYTVKEKLLITLNLKRNAFWNNLDFTHAAIDACCALHNFLEERDVVLPGEEEEVDHVGLAMIDDHVHQGQNGQDTSSLLAQWVSEHTPCIPVVKSVITRPRCC
jgi:hypothetical protein